MHRDPREGFDPYRDTVGPGIYGGIVKRDENGEVKLKIIFINYYEDFHGKKAIFFF